MCSSDLGNARASYVSVRHSSATWKLMWTVCSIGGVNFDLGSLLTSFTKDANSSFDNDLLLVA